uniref:Protein kinase domain-containing protein n=1 Tax=Chromera velia CCMP2878 TaxID=1169474 RepID=A0A0G4FN60_9ALVE
MVDRFRLRSLKIIDYNLFRYRPKRDIHLEETGDVKERELQPSAPLGTRIYEPPEVTATAPPYISSVDTWSAAVVAAELVSRTPLFRDPRHDATRRFQLGKVVRLIGPPPESFIQRVRRKDLKLFLDQKRQTERVPTTAEVQDTKGMAKSRAYKLRFELMACRCGLL